MVLCEDDVHGPDAPSGSMPHEDAGGHGAYALRDATQMFIVDSGASSNYVVPGTPLTETRPCNRKLRADRPERNSSCKPKTLLIISPPDTNA